MEMIAWLQQWLANDDTKLIYLLTLILMANVFDFFLGWINARFNPKVDFSSSQAIFGIARKMVIFMLLVYFIPVALLAPDPIGIGALYVLYVGYLLSELNSVFSHMGLAKDGKQANLFADFLNSIFTKGKED